ncbi:MAG: ligase-associated DNA damage response DEXH box helicase [Bacteroidia bacterium]|nr:ligase-associated DNA damage response DEXH box helicase [Bacteroidia bacterium]
MPVKKKLSKSELLQLALDWYHGRNWDPFPFQLDTIKEILSHKHGLLNAPTGSGKTYGLWIPILIKWISQNPSNYKEREKNGLQAIWITPLRALSKDIRQACQDACTELEVPWKVEIRTGDTTSSQKARQKRQMPEGLVTTPESLHVLFSNKGHKKYFENLQVIVIDEWHELLGTKRGVQVELAIAHLKKINPKLLVWGISATIGNMNQALEVLLGNAFKDGKHSFIKAEINKRIEVESVLPDSIEKFPWSGHLGINMVDKVLPIIHRFQTTLIFTNTRAQCELWYQTLLAAEPDLAGTIAMHHGSIDAELRSWVEDALHNEQLKAVVCTSSLDLGVDFRPVEAVIQIGGPKGIARFVQRAGRSGHQPGASSKIHFVPTHSLELIEAAALREAVKSQKLEDRKPIVNPFDVLIQYLINLAVADGFKATEVYQTVIQTFAYQYLSEEEFSWMLDFITTGGDSLKAYDEYKKVEIEEDGTYKVHSKKIALQHRLSIGTIVGDVNMTVKYVSGGRIGTVEETFISQLNPGDVFWFAGRSLELVRIRNLEVQVKRSKSKKGKVPRWMGSRMLLSSQMSQSLKQKLQDYLDRDFSTVELQKLVPLFELQQKWSSIPGINECLIESIESREGYHLFVYPFEGRVVHQIMSALVAWRLTLIRPMSFSIAMNDYGFELLSDVPIPIDEGLERNIFSPEALDEDLQRAINESEMASRRFREIATIAGLVFQGYPGKQMKSRHLQASTSLLFKVFKEYDPSNLLLRQAYDEVINYQLDMERLVIAMERLNGRDVIMERPHAFTPFCFPIMVDRLRERLSTEKLIDRVAKMQVQLERRAG